MPVPGNFIVMVQVSVCATVDARYGTGTAARSPGTSESAALVRLSRANHSLGLKPYR